VDDDAAWFDFEELPQAATSASTTMSAPVSRCLVTWVILAEAEASPIQSVDSHQRSW
jgi:hypothetical protein